MPRVASKLRLAAALVAVGLLALLAPATAPAAGWTAQSSGTIDNLWGVSCPTATSCWATGSAGRIVATANGITWSSQSSGVTASLGGVSCPTATSCWAVGADGMILTTSNAGANWSSQPSGVTDYLQGVDCATSTACWAVGASGRILATVNGGTSWSAQSSGTTDLLYDLSCPTAATCWVVGANGRILTTSNGGGSWSSQSSGTTDTLTDIDCPTTTSCRAVGALGRIVTTANGGATWSSQTVGSATLYGVACPTAATCWAVGASGAILTTTNGGATWSSQASGVTETLQGVACPSASTCWAVGSSGRILRYDATSAYPSNDCDPGAAVLDGFVSDTHYKLRTSADPLEPTTTWVCFAVDAAGGHFGGRLAVSRSAADSVAVDEQQADCDANPGSRLLDEDGQVGPIPFDLDVNRAPTGEVWVCVMANDETLAKRVQIDSSAIPGVTFLPDAPLPYPYVERPSPGSASAACQAAGSGKTRLINADVGAGHVWLYSWAESGTRSHACTRVQTPSTTAGGRLTLDGNVSQTFVTDDTSSDFGPCETNILTLTTPPLSIRTHAGSPPGWLCVRADTAYRRVKLDTAGGQGVVTFTPDG